MEMDEGYLAFLRETEERIRSVHKERGASLRGLCRLHLSVDDGGSRVPFDEHPTESVSTISTITFRLHDPEMEGQIEAYHRERMALVRAAFPEVEKQIREAGITLLSKEEWRETPGRPRLVVAIDLGKPKKGASFFARLRVEQEVQMVRDPGMRMTMTTFGNVTRKRKYKHGGVSAVFDDLLHYFLHFYRVANDMDDDRDQLNLR